MKVNDVIDFFSDNGTRNKTKCAEKIGITRGVIYQWIRKGYIPLQSQLHLSKLSDGALKVSSFKKEKGKKMVIEDE